MTRKSIEATAKYFIWGLFALFLFVVYNILQMMGVVYEGGWTNSALNYRGGG